jgi:hypothetical protein
LIPTVSDTVRAYTRRFFLGDSVGWRAAPLMIVIYVSALLLVVPVNEGERFMPPAVAIFGCVAALDVAHREYRFGGSPKLILVAALTTGVITAALFVPVVALRLAVGGPPLPFLDVLVVLLTIGLLIAYFGGGWSKRADAAFEGEVRAERARRGIDAVASGMAGSDPGRGLWAYVFLLALGGFGLLITAFAWARYPGWPYVALGVAINGPLAVFGLIGIVRARRAPRP